MLQQAINNPDDQTAYDVLGTVTQVEEVKYSKKGKPNQKVTINDGVTTHQVTIWLGKNPPLAVTPQRLAFSLKGRMYQNNLYLSGFWNSDAGVNQNVPSPAPPQGQPTTPKDTLIIRQAVLKALGPALAAGKIDLGTMQVTAEELTNYVLNGLQDEPEEPELEPTPADEIPF